MKTILEQEKEHPEALRFVLVILSFFATVQKHVFYRHSREDTTPKATKRKEKQLKYQGRIPETWQESPPFLCNE